LQRSLQAWQGKPVTTSYKPFLLDPTIPVEGVDFLKYMKKKGGGRISPEQFFTGPSQMGEQIGLDFNFFDISKAPNTMLAHCLIEITPKDKKSEMIEALYDAFFQHGRDVGNLNTLLDLAEELGLDRGWVRAGLADPAVRKQVETEVNTAYHKGISGVPFFIINNKYAFSGAHQPETILEILSQVAEMPQ
jgi:predicted DsbA family dithiol-disulfide isomerase